MSTVDIENLTLDVLFTAFWQFTVLLFVKKVNDSFFDPQKKMYSQKSWEHEGKFYTSVLRINLWKDLLPQHVGKKGFSKKKLNNYNAISDDYINKFILETCRAEWYHTVCILECVFFFIISQKLLYKLLFSFLSLLLNLPFLIIQRYNRFRLIKLSRKIQSKHTFN